MTCFLRLRPILYACIVTQCCGQSLTSKIAFFPFLDGDVRRFTSYSVYILNSFVLLEQLAMLLTSTLAIIGNSESS